MDTNEFKDFYKRKNYRPYGTKPKQFEGYKQAMKDVLKIIEQSQDLWDLQSRLKLAKTEDLGRTSWLYQYGYNEFIIQIKSEVHRRKLIIKQNLK